MITYDLWNSLSLTTVQTIVIYKMSIENMKERILEPLAVQGRDSGA
jgi:hypothetical protein